ncbi:MAG: hypothetical protein AABZ47_06235 [Planctomycetota bacterium]
MSEKTSRSGAWIWAAASFLLLGVAVSRLPLFLPGTTSYWHHSTVSIGGSVVILAVWGGYEWHRRRRFPALLEQARQLLWCPGCRYSLRGLSPQGNCPECGKPYDHADVLERWK